MATNQLGLLEKWLTLRNQGANSATGEGDGPGLQTDWGKLFGGAADQYETARGLGYSGSMPVQSYGDSSEYQPGNPQKELFDWMQSSGYDYGINPTFNGGQQNVWLDPQGQEVAGTRREFEAQDDSDFWGAALAAGGLMGGAAAGGIGSIGAGYGLSGNAALGAGGATVGAGVGGFNAAVEGENILKGALKGGAIGGIGAYVGGVANDFFGQFAGAPDAMGDYMRTGASEGSTIGNSYTGAGGQAGAVGANSIAAQMGIPSDFDPESLFRNVADPTAALQPLPEIGQAPGGMPGLPPQFDPYSQSVEVTGQRLPFEPMPPTGLQPLAPFDGSSLGIAGSGAALAPLGPTFSMPGAMPSAVAGGLLSNLPPGVGDALKSALPIAGAIAGSQPSGGDTSTTQQRTDPRMDPYIYQQFLPEWSKQFAASNGGVNDTMRAGWNQQLGLLNDPGIAQQLNGSRNNGLINGPVAGNPFTTGQMRLPSGGQGLLGQMQMPRDPSRRFTG